MQPESGWPGNLFAIERRKQLGRSIVLGNLAGLLLVFFPGCRPSPTPSGQRSEAPAATALRVACPNADLVTLVREKGTSWAARQGVHLEVLLCEPPASPEGLSADLWILPPAEMPSWVAADKLRPIPTSITADPEFAWSKLLPLYRSKLLTWDQKVYGLPLLGDALVCCYREDWLQDPAHRSAFRRQFGRDLTPPDTWEDFAEIAEYFQKQGSADSSKHRACLPPLPTDDDRLDREFYTMAAPLARRAMREDVRKLPSDGELFSFHYDLDSGAVRIDTPGFVQALKLMQRLQKARPAQPAADPAAAFANGQAVLCLATPPEIARFQKSPAVRDRFGIRRVPGSRQVFDYRTGTPQEIAGGNHVPYLGAQGAMTVVPGAASDSAADAAFRLAAYLASPAISRDIIIEPQWGGGVFRRDHLDTGVGWQSFGLSPVRTEALVDCLRESAVHAQVVNPVLRLRTPDQASHRQALLAEIRAALQTGQDAEQALHRAADRWRKIDALIDPNLRKAYYRRSLSLGGAS